MSFYRSAADSILTLSSDPSSLVVDNFSTRFDGKHSRSSTSICQWTALADEIADEKPSELSPAMIPPLQGRKSQEIVTSLPHTDLVGSENHDRIGSSSLQHALMSGAENDIYLTMLYDDPAKAQDLSPVQGQELSYLQYSVEASPPKTNPRNLNCCLLVPRVGAVRQLVAAKAILPAASTFQQICASLAANGAGLHDSIYKTSPHTEGIIQHVHVPLDITMIKKELVFKDSTKALDYREKTVAAVTVHPTAENSAVHTWLTSVRETCRKQCTTGSSSNSSGAPTGSTQSADNTRGHALKRSDSAGSTQRGSQIDGDSDDSDGEDRSMPGHDDGGLSVAPSDRLYACPYSKYDPSEHADCRMKKYERIDSVRSHIESVHEKERDGECAERFSKAKRRYQKCEKQKWLEFYRALFGTVQDRHRTVVVDPFWTPPICRSSPTELGRAITAATGLAQVTGLTENEKLLACAALECYKKHEHNNSSQEVPTTIGLTPRDARSESRAAAVRSILNACELEAHANVQRLCQGALQCSLNLVSTDSDPTAQSISSTTSSCGKLVSREENTQFEPANATAQNLIPGLLQPAGIPSTLCFEEPYRDVQNFGHDLGQYEPPEHNSFQQSSAWRHSNPVSYWWPMTTNPAYDTQVSSYQTQTSQAGAIPPVTVECMSYDPGSSVDGTCQWCGNGPGYD